MLGGLGQEDPGSLRKLEGRRALEDPQHMGMPSRVWAPGVRKGCVDSGGKGWASPVFLGLKEPCEALSF